MTYKLQPEHTGLVKPGTVDSQFVQLVLFTYIQTRNYGINNMNLEHITEWVLHVYSMGTRYILNVITQQSNPSISKFSRLCNEFTSVWSMFPYNR